MILPSLLAKLTGLIERYEELGHLLSDAETIANQDRFRALSQEYKEVEPVVLHYREYQALTEAPRARRPGGSRQSGCGRQVWRHLTWEAFWQRHAERRRRCCSRRRKERRPPGKRWH